MPKLAFMNMYSHTRITPRHACITLVSHKYFDPSILILIFLNTLSLCIESLDPLETAQNTKDVLFVLEIMFLALFTIEMLLKILAMGFVVCVCVCVCVCVYCYVISYSLSLCTLTHTRLPCSHR
jgi:hypothetical protein